MVEHIPINLSHRMPFNYFHLISSWFDQFNRICRRKWKWVKMAEEMKILIILINSTKIEPLPTSFEMPNYRSSHRINFIQISVLCNFLFSHDNNRLFCTWCEWLKFRVYETSMKLHKCVRGPNFQPEFEFN